MSTPEGNVFAMVSGCSGLLDGAGRGAGRRVTRRQQFVAGATGLGGLLLAACAVAGPPAPQGSKKPPTSLEVWIWETVDHWEKVIKGSGIEQALPEVQLKYVALSSADIYQKFFLGMVSGGTGIPDICRFSTNRYYEAVDLGGLIETTDKVGQHKKDVEPSFYEGGLFKGKAYSVPDDLGAVMMAYRVDLFERVGLPTDPAAVARLWPTWDEYIRVGSDAARKLGVNLINAGAAGVFGNMALQDSTGYFDKDGNVIFDSAYHAKAMETVKRLFDTGLVGLGNLGGIGVWEAHNTGKLLTHIWANWNDFTFQDNAPETKEKWRVARLPAVQPGGKRIAAANGCCLVVAKAVPADRRELGLKTALYLRLTKQATVAHMDSFPGAFVSYVPGLEAVRDRPSPILNGQKSYDLFLTAIEQEKMNPWYKNSVYFSRAGGEFVNVAVTAIMNQGAPIAATLKNEANRLRALQQQEGKR